MGARTTVAGRPSYHRLTPAPSRGWDCSEQVLVRICVRNVGRGEKVEKCSVWGYKVCDFLL